MGTAEAIKSKSEQKNFMIYRKLVESKETLM